MHPGDGRAVITAVVLTVAAAVSGNAQSVETLKLRGQPQTLHVYGTRGAGYPVVVSSGDGGWIHLAPHVAEVLAKNGFFVVGFDVKSYLEGFTSGSTTLRKEDEPSDYRVLVDFAARGASDSAKPILIGASEGAGLSVLAATDPHTKQSIAGVIGLGLPNLTELGWRWRDSLIYITHAVPKEPTFSTAAVVGQVAPVPLAAIHSTNDEFVPVNEVRKILDVAGEPKRLWIIKASNHRFSDNQQEFDQRLLEAIAWVRQNQAR
jgi:fermentation-respiration switch protein FrsA (DUF1100 family)